MTYLRRKYHKPGTAPGTYDIDRTREAETPQIVVTDYSAEQVSVIRDPVSLSLAATEGVRWVRISGRPSLDVLESLREHFDVEPLVLEDIVTTGQRPRFNAHGAGLFVTASVPDLAAGVGFQQLSIYLTGNTVISHMADEAAFFEPLLERMNQNNSRLRTGNAYHLLYALLDLSIDHLFPLLDDVGDRMEILESQILTNPTPALLSEVHTMRNDLLLLRKISWATRELISDLLRHLDNDDAESVRSYVQDAYDHIVGAIDLVEIFRDMATSLIEVHLSVISNRMNEVIRVLTIIATLFIPPTFVVGVYGMNFDRAVAPWSMPELGWSFGYVMVMSLIAFMMIGMLLFFRHKRWL